MLKKIIDLLVEVSCVYVSVVAGAWVFELLAPAAASERGSLGAVGGELLAAVVLGVVLYYILGSIADYFMERWWEDGE